MLVSINKRKKKKRRKKNPYSPNDTPVVIWSPTIGVGHKHKRSCDHEKKATIAANHLKNLAGDTWNINESKINLDS